MPLCNSTGTLTDKNRISTGDVTHEFRTNSMVMDSDRTSNGRLCPFCPVESFEHVQNFPPDRTDINGHHRTRNGFTRLETDIKRKRTDTNGLKEFLSVTHPLAGCDRNLKDTVMTLNFWTDRSGQTVQTQIRLLPSLFAIPFAPF